VIRSRRAVLTGGAAGLIACAAGPAFAAPALVTPDDPRYASFAAARRAAWGAVGPFDDDVIGNLVSPEFQGYPAWPTTRQSFLVVRPQASLVIASDGLSDLFAGTDLAQPGFECEVFIEAPDLAGAAFTAIRDSWQFQLVENFARNVADFGGITGPLEKYGTISMELPAPDAMPPRWTTPRGTVGALVGIEVPERPARCRLAEDASIRLTALTLLLPDETDHVIAGGSAARAAIAQRLVLAGTGLTSPANRRSVLA
jgi:hypothetical protein